LIRGALFLGHSESHPGFDLGRITFLVPRISCWYTKYKKVLSKWLDFLSSLRLLCKTVLISTTLSSFNPSFEPLGHIFHEPLAMDGKEVTPTMVPNGGGSPTSPHHSGAGYDSEKIGVQELERTGTEINDADISEFSAEEQKKIIRRIDYRLVTTLGLLYMCSLMDRTNLGAANIAG
jgi:hypothetical protein